MGSVVLAEPRVSEHQQTSTCRFVLSVDESDSSLGTAVAFQPQPS